MDVGDMVFDGVRQAANPAAYLEQLEGSHLNELLAYCEAPEVHGALKGKPAVDAMAAVLRINFVASLARNEIVRRWREAIS